MNAANIKQIDARQASKNLETYQVIDVREPHEYCDASGHIETATLMPLSRLDESLLALNNSRPVLAVCRSGRRSMVACQLLMSHGIECVNLEGGMQQWTTLRLPTQGCSEKQTQSATQC